MEAHWKYASELLAYFTEQGRVLYGKEFLVYNVHLMIHLAAEAKHYGGLDKCSGFPFKNYMHKLKKMVRSGNPISEKTVRFMLQNLWKQHVHLVIPTKKPNNVFILDDKSCCQVLEMINQFNAGGDLLYKCRVYGHLSPLFDHPCDSRVVNVFKTSNHWTKIELLSSVNFEQTEMMCEIGSGETVIFMAILHNVRII